MKIPPTAVSGGSGSVRSTVSRDGEVLPSKRYGRSPRLVVDIESPLSIPPYPLGFATGGGADEVELGMLPWGREDISGLLLDMSPLPEGACGVVRSWRSGAPPVGDPAPLAEGSAANAASGIASTAEINTAERYLRCISISFD